MKNLGFCIIAAAVISAAACQAVEPTMQQEDSTNMVTASFRAEVLEPVATKATLTPGEGETSFAAGWSKGDAIRVDYFALDMDENAYEDTVEAVWDGSSFSAVLPDITGLWEYRACYPCPEEGKVAFGSYRTQTGNEYNSMYDLMMSSAVGTSDAAAGKTESGANVVFPMERQTAIVRFHFTTSLDEPIQSATLSVKGGAICAGDVSFSPSEVKFEKCGSEIYLYPTEQTADDFVLWFNVLPCSFDEMTITVKSSTSHFSFTRGAGSFSKGVLYNIAADVAPSKWEVTEDQLVGYALVQSEPSDWSGTYLAAYVSGSQAKVYTGVDAADNFESATVNNYSIVKSGSMAELEVEAKDEGYTVKVIGGLNDGKYISGGASNGTTFGTSAVVGTFTFNEDDCTAYFSTNGTTSFQFNKASNQQRFRFFKSEQEGVCFFRKGGISGGYTTSATVSTGNATGISQADAVLNGSYQASAVPTEVGFLWGASADAVDKELYADSGIGLTGSFSKSLAGLSPSTTYWYRSYAVVDGKYFYGSVASFTTTAITSGTGTESAYAMSWLGGYEVPATGVGVSESNMTYAGRYCHSTVSESFGDTKACIYNTGSSSQRIVTHTYSYGGNIYPNYTILYDADKHCSLWEAFTLGGDENRDNNVGRNDSWAYDPALPSEWQPRLSSSYSGGYTRGHAIASNYRQTTTVQNKQTFYYSNMTPQSSTLNSGSWNSLEQKVNGLGTQLGSSSRLYVVTGPIFDSGYGTTTDRDGLVCPIPTRYYKCIMRCEFNSDGQMTSAKGAGYMYNHTGNLSRQDMTIDQVEAITGFDFFANVPDAIESSAEANFYTFF